ncbi:MAG: hypothetical protein R3300_17410 [Candidatus Promineifilaceae bacterium]|nr:hypothetical protein [Candidatus Promineifilaceae bacterium]
MLKRNGYATEVQSAGEAGRVDRLAVTLADDYRERPQRLYLSLASDAQAARQEQGEAPADTATPYDEIDFLQFYCQLPFRPQPESRPALAQYLHTLNRQLPLPGFGLKEEAVFFRYLLVTAGDEIPDRLLYETVTLIEFILKRTLAGIEQRASASG